MLNNTRRESRDTVPDEPVMSLLEAAAAPSEPGPLPGEADALAAFRASQANSRRSSMLSSLTSVKAGVAAALGAGVLLTGSVGMAAAGALPDGAQATASDLLSKVGVTVPGSGEQTVADADQDETSTDDTAGEHEMPEASQKGQDVSELARTTEKTGADKGAEISELASEGRSGAGEDRGDDASVDGMATASDKRAAAEEHADEAGDHADERAGGSDDADDDEGHQGSEAHDDADEERGSNEAGDRR